MSEGMSLFEVLAQAQNADIERERNRRANEAQERKAWLANSRRLLGTVGIESIVDKAADAVQDKNEGKPLDVPKKEVTPNARFPLPPGAKR